MSSVSYIPYLYQSVISTAASLILGGVWWNYRNMQLRLEKSMTKEDTRSLIEDKLRAVQLDIDNLKSQVSRIDANVMKLLEIQIKHGN